MSSINEEKKASEKYMLSTLDNGNIVELSLDNVARVEAMILNDSAYLRSSDKNAEPENKKKNGYGGSTAYHMCKLKEVLIGNLEIDDDSYTKLIMNAVKSVDRENSTHLNADKVGIREITKRIAELDRPTVLYYLKHPDSADHGLIDIISEPTVPDDSDHSSRENLSFASKFCHYACFYIFEGTEYQDNYSIYDNVMVNALPKYIHHYGLSEYDLGNYFEYKCAIDEVIKVSKSNISRNGFDHLLWYYHKGRD